nr:MULTISPECIES: Ig-like domain-containing protein [Bacillus]
MRPTFEGVSYLPNGNATFTFSEPIDATVAQIVAALNVTGPTSVEVVAGDVTLSTTKKSFTVALPATMTKDQNYTFTFTGLKDFAGNLLAPNPVSATVVKKDADTVKPTVTSVASAGIGKVAVTFSEKVDATSATLKVGGTAATGLTTSTDAGKTVITFNSADLTAGVKSLEIGGVKDLAGNIMDAVTKVVEITADKTAPVFVSQSIKTVGSDQYLVVNYNEEITVDTTKDVTGSYVGSDSITKSVTIDKANIALGSDKKSVEIKLPTTTGDYTVTLPTVKDTATNPAASKTVTFKLGTAADTTKPNVSTVVQTNNKVVVTFDREVSAASALDNANYELEGVSSAFVGTPIFKGDAKTVELTLKDDAITTNGERNFTVKNVATGAGAVMVTEVKARDFKETVRPTVVSAKVTGAKTIEITFSEAIKDGATAGKDIDVYQGLSTTALAEDSELISGNKLVITLTSELISLSGITVKASDVADLTDINGNVHNVTGTINVQ